MALHLLTEFQSELIEAGSHIFDICLYDTIFHSSN